MTLEELEVYLQTVRGISPNGRKIGGYFEVEYETDEDFYLYAFDYNFEKQRFECGYSIYHASEDNNANNPEAHTDEDEGYSANLKELVDALIEEQGDLFKDNFYKDLERFTVEKKGGN